MVTSDKARCTFFCSHSAHIASALQSVIILFLDHAVSVSLKQVAGKLRIITEQSYNMRAKLELVNSKS